MFLAHNVHYLIEPVVSLMEFIMSRSINCIVIVFFLLFSAASSAAIIAMEDYISFDKNNDGILDFDIVWASSIGFQFYGCDGVIADPENYLNTVYGAVAGEDVDCDNQLLGPDFADDDWSFVDDVDSVQDVEDLILADIKALFDAGEFSINAQYVNAFDEYNTGDETIVSVNPFQQTVISDWTAALEGEYANVFYARVHQEVPEPATIMILALGLIGLASRRKLQS
jgi:hypothetical protein